mmetsp:Transcript_16265/g.56754  ORF Transcript_16265/g.56754 Transcript_16265/m.56754 type:complete len:202 (-) Transcript_16265:234-839(-)
MCGPGGGSSMVAMTKDRCKLGWRARTDCRPRSCTPSRPTSSRTMVNLPRFRSLAQFAEYCIVQIVRTFSPGRVVTTSCMPSTSAQSPGSTKSRSSSSSQAHWCVGSVTATRCRRCLSWLIMNRVLLSGPWPPLDNQAPSSYLAGRGMACRQSCSSHVAGCESQTSETRRPHSGGWPSWTTRGSTPESASNWPPKEHSRPLR